METQSIIQQIYSHVESGAVDKAVFACVRLARSVGDIISLLGFLRELSSDRNQFSTQLFEETRTLNEEAQKFLWTTTNKKWLEGRTLEHFSGGKDESGEAKNVLTPGIGELQRELEQLEKSIADIQVPSGMGAFDTAAFTDRYVNTKGAIRQRIGANNTVIERVRTRCLNYASRIEKQLAAQAGNQQFLVEVQSSVNNFLAGRSSETYEKLMKAAQLANSRDPEDSALLLTSLRRAINAVADYFYPPRDGEVVCRDGKSRKMGHDQYMNRLQEYCAGLIGSSTADSLLEAELGYLAAFGRRLNDIASKGVHSSVTAQEARQGLIGFYMFLSNLITRIEKQAPNQAVEGTGDPQTARQSPHG